MFDGGSTKELVFFKPGDLVVLNKPELHSPVMVISEKVSKQFRGEDGGLNNIFKGMKCMWFDKNDELHEAIFSTKDLEHYKK